MTITKSDTKQFDAIGKMNVFQARQSGIDIIKNSKSTNAKKMRLIRDLSKAPTSDEVVRILWMCALASEGLSSMDSSWNKV